MLPLRIARSKLARISKTDVRFLSKNFILHDKQFLLHGAELIAGYFDVHPDELESAFNLDSKESERELYTVNNITTILDTLHQNKAKALKHDFIKMIVFDAFVGAPDRHGMNWGVLESLDAESDGVSFAPIFDTARGLFREISDVDLSKHARKGRENFLAKYAERSRPILGTGDGGHLNHFDLIGWIIRQQDDADRKAVNEVIDAIDICSIEHMLQRNFRRIITQYRIEMIRDLLLVRLRRIREVCLR